MRFHRLLPVMYRYYLRASLSVKTLAIAVFLMIMMGIVLDAIHQSRFSDWFQEEFTLQDQHAAEAVYARFRSSVQSYSHFARLVSRQTHVVDYTSSLSTQGATKGMSRWYSWRREWMPMIDIQQAFPNIGVAMILDHSTGNVLEGYQEGEAVSIETLEGWASHFRWNAKRSGIVLLDDVPLLFAIHPMEISAESIRGGYQRSLLIASPLTTGFLNSVLSGYSDRFLALIEKGGNSSIVGSSAVEWLTPGAWGSHGLQEHEELARYSVDPEHPEMKLYLTLHRAHARQKGLLEIPMWLDRQQRFLSGIVLLGLFLLGVSWLAGRINRINTILMNLSQRMGMSFSSNRNGDELHTLEANLQRFTEEVIAETNALEYQALHDSLTGLPNRVLLQDRLEHAIAQTLREQRNLAFFLMDLDRFKEINDTLGHHIGDRLLQEAAKRIHSVLRKADTVARLGGDEFAVLLPSTDQKHAKIVCKKIIDAINQPFTLENLCLRIGVSIGVVMCPEHGEDTTTLLQRADVAMYAAKKAGIGFSFYKPQEDEHSISRLGLVGELRDAVEKNQLELCYQPMVDFRTGKINAAEALVRWNHPTLGQIKPDEFIPLAEQSGVIRDLTMWVLHHALLQWSQWHQDGIELQLSLNMSVRVLQDKELPAKVQRLIEHHGISPSWVTLEITESAIMSDPATARRVMRRLSEMGLKISIDDFGTGYSSLAYLKQLPVNTVKIDKSFITQMDMNENDAVIVRATIDLAHNLGLKVVAEGIETEDVWDLLEMLGCDVAQGYLIRHPVSAPELARWIASHRWKSERWASHCLAQVPA